MPSWTESSRVLLSVSPSGSLQHRRPATVTRLRGWRSQSKHRPQGEAARFVRLLARGQKLSVPGATKLNSSSGRLFGLSRRPSLYRKKTATQWAGIRSISVAAGQRHLHPRHRRTWDAMTRAISWALQVERGHQGHGGSRLCR